MLKFNFDNCMADVVGEQNGVAEGEWKKHDGTFSKAHDVLMGWRQSKDAIFFDMPSQTDMIKAFESKAASVKGRFRNIMVLGIGGSALGLSCMAKATLPPFYNLREDGCSRLFVCDNVDPESFNALLTMLDPGDTFVNVISKSGGTTETMSQFALAKAWLEKAVGQRWKEHVTATTDPESGKLRAYATEHGIETFDVPPKLGGRFSVISSVGLFPAACLGVDIRGVMKGAAQMAKRCEEANAWENPGYRIGGLNYLLSTNKGKFVSVMMPYSDRFSLFGDWYAQLWAESLGKEGKGQTVVKSLGATDQHSQIQLFMEGPNDKFLNFLGVESFDDEGMSIDEPFPSFDYLKGKKLGDILRAEEKATSAALAKQGRPNMTVTADRANAESLGELFMVYEVACAYCGALMEINPFNQPGVELGKKLTKEILGG